MAARLRRWRALNLQVAWANGVSIGRSSSVTRPWPRPGSTSGVAAGRPTFTSAPESESRHGPRCCCRTSPQAKAAIPRTRLIRSADRGWRWG